MYPCDTRATDIGYYSFSKCENLESVTIPGSIKEIHKCTFSSCTGLKSVTIQNGVTEIGSFAFGSCLNLTDVTIPDSVTNIDYDAFAAEGRSSETIKNLVIHCSAGSYAESYAKELNIKYSLI